MEGGPPRFIPGSTCPALLGDFPRRHARFAYGALTPYGGPSQAASAARVLSDCVQARQDLRGSPATPHAATAAAYRLAWVWAGARSLAATSAISVDFSSSGYLDVSVPPVVPTRPILFRRGCPGIAPGGLPHSEIRGSEGVCPSPRLIAACHVLRRLPVPRHPPCALDIFPTRIRKRTHIVPPLFCAAAGAARSLHQVNPAHMCAGVQKIRLRS